MAECCTKNGIIITASQNEIRPIKGQLATGASQCFLLSIVSGYATGMSWSSAFENADETPCISLMHVVTVAVRQQQQRGNIHINQFMSCPCKAQLAIWNIFCNERQQPIANCSTDANSSCPNNEAMDRSVA